MSSIDPAELEKKRRRHRNERIVAAALILLVGASVWWVGHWNRREAASLRKDQTYIPRPLRMTPEVTMLQELVRIDSSKPEGVAAAARWVAAHLKRNGIDAEIIESAPSMLNVYARIRGRSPGQGLLLFNHLDVVPAGEGWTRPPYDAFLFGDRMYGRGTVDMKGITICQLAAFVAVAKSGRVPEHDLVFLATADEETGSTWGMQWLLAHRPDIFTGVAYGITEGGLTEIMSDRMTYFGIEIGGKQLVQVVVEAASKERLQQTRVALEPYIASRHPDRVLPEVKRFFAQLAATRVAFRPYLADIDATIETGQFWRLPPTYRDLVQNSIGTGPVRQVGDRWEMQVSMVNLSDEHPEKRIAWLDETVSAFDARVSRILVKEGPNVFSAENTLVFSLLAKAARERHGVVAGTYILYRSISDCRFLRPRGIACYGVSPYRVTYFESIAIHGTDESINVGAFQDGVEYLKDVVTDWSIN